MYTGTQRLAVHRQEPWGTHYNYDDPKFQKTIGWWRVLIEKGYMPTARRSHRSGLVRTIYGAGKYAMITNGSWMIGTHVPAPRASRPASRRPRVGPSGKRASMFNGLADSIWVGSKNKPAAAKWVEFLGSAGLPGHRRRRRRRLPGYPERHRQG